MDKIKKRNDGRFVITKIYSDKRKFFYGKSKQECKNKQLVYEQQLHRDITKSNTKLKDWIEIWYTVVGANVTPSTLSNYKNIINTRILPFWGEIELDSINHIDVRTRLATELSSGYATRTINYTLMLFKTILQQAVEDNVLKINPLSKIKKLKGQPPKEKIVITPQQFNELIDVAPSDTIKRMLNVAIRTGLRREELLGLRFSDIDYNQQTITIKQTVIRQHNKTVIVNSTKTKSSVRTLRISDFLVNAFKEQRKKVMRDIQVCPLYRNFGLVFCSDNGTPMTPNNFSRVIVNCGKRANLPKGFSYYSLRHTHATMLLMNGATIKDVQFQLGHKTFSTTAQYLHATPMLQNMFVTRLDEAILPKKSIAERQEK